jgi:hypothetical protein
VGKREGSDYHAVLRSDGTGQTCGHVGIYERRPAVGSLNRTRRFIVYRVARLDVS